MSFTTTELQRGIEGDLAYAIFKCVNTSGSTGGTITTGLGSIIFANIQEQGTAVEASGAVVNGTFPIASGSLTIVTAANVTVYVRVLGTI